MKTGWVILIAAIALVLGFIAGGLVGGAGGVIGGGLAGVCYTADAAVKEGFMTDDERRALLQSFTVKHPEVSAKLEAKGDLTSICSEILKS